MECNWKAFHMIRVNSLVLIKVFINCFIFIAIHKNGTIGKNRGSIDFKSIMVSEVPKIGSPLPL